MFTDILNKQIFQHSITLPLTDEVHAELKRAGIVLPRSLDAAVPKRQNEFLAGRYCAWRALRLASKEFESTVEIKIDIDRGPIWPDGWVGSITHTHAIAAAAVAPAKDLLGLGIDVECIMSSERAENIASSILTPGESLYIQDFVTKESGFTFAEMVTLFFSAKESLYKALRPRVGRYFGFHDVEIVAVHQSLGTLQFRLLDALTEDLAIGWEGTGHYRLSEPHVFASFEWRK